MSASVLNQEKDMEIEPIEHTSMIGGSMEKGTAQDAMDLEKEGVGTQSPGVGITWSDLLPRLTTTAIGMRLWLMPGHSEATNQGWPSMLYNDSASTHSKLPVLKM